MKWTVEKYPRWNFKLPRKLRNSKTKVDTILWAKVQIVWAPEYLVPSRFTDQQ